MAAGKTTDAIRARLSVLDTAMVLFSLVGALTFAEIGSRYPRAGGYYRVVADCYNPTLAFMLNWAQTLMQGAGAAAVAFIGADYLVPILPPQWRVPQAPLVLACTTMSILLVLNYRGVKPGARVQDIGLAFFAATMLLPAFVLGSFEKLVDYVIFTDTLTLAVVASTLFVLRGRHVGDGAYCMRGYPLLPALYIACLLGVAMRVFTLEPNLALAGAAILLTGWPLFKLGRRLFSRRGH